MGASFEEKSVWIQLIGTLIGLGTYFAVAGRMIAAGTMALPAYVPVFIGAVVVMVAITVAGFIVAAVTGRTDGRDERDRLIGWRAESESGWIVAAGVVTAITAMILDVHMVWIANGLLASLFVSEMVGYVLRIVYYRRGMSGAGGA